MKQISAELQEVVDQTGYRGASSLWFLHDVIEAVGPECVLELGTGFGCSAIFMAMAGSGTVYSVDDYRGDTTTDVDVVRNNLEKCGVSGKIVLIEGDSRTVPIVTHRYVEVLFMDASHNRKDLWLEYDNVLANLSEDHLILIDDYNSPGVKEFFEELCRKHGVRYGLRALVDVHEGVAVVGTSIDRYMAAVSKAAGWVTER